MKTVHSKILLCAILAAILQRANGTHFMVTVFVCAVLFWWIRTKDRSWVLLVLILGWLWIPHYQSAYPTITSGRVVEVHTSYCVVQQDRFRVLFYPDQMPIFDSTVSFEPSFQRLQSSKGFFTSDFAASQKRKGVTYSSSSTLTEIKPSKSLRGAIQMKIQSISEEDTRNLLFRILLGIRSQEDTLDSYLNESGFSLSGILLVLQKILQYCLPRKQRSIVLLSINFLLILIFHAPLLLVESALFRIFACTKLDRSQKIGYPMYLTLLLYPDAMHSASFLIPVLYRLCAVSSSDPKRSRFLFGMWIQSILFHQVNPITMWLYPVLLPITSISFFLALLQLLFPSIAWLGLVTGLDHCLRIFRFGDLPGTMLGAGLIFYVGILLCFRRSKHWVSIALVWFFVFQIGGFFHPFAEITVLNVGQGDSILLRAPLNQENILIDTGKPSKWNTLSTFLDAKGIRSLQTLIVTHADNDHSGNQERVIETYSPNQVITTHIPSLPTKHFQLYDLNSLTNEDENQSSIVTALQVNGMRILLMGDADQVTESQIAKTYANFSVDVLKLSHHGSKTGSSEEFLDVVNPNLGIISAGNYSLYHHPSPETIQRLLKRHIPYLNTLEEGDITICCIGPLNLGITSKGTIFFIHSQGSMIK